MTATAAVVAVAGYTVCCPQCGEQLVAPESLGGRTLWLAREVSDYPRVYCPQCDTTWPLAPMPVTLTSERE